MADNRLFRDGGTSNSRLRSKGTRPLKTSLKILSEKSKSFGNSINSEQLNKLIGSPNFHDFKREKVYAFDPSLRPDYNFDISFDLTNVQVTSFDPAGNENDRPRINTFRVDGEHIIYLSAGGSYYDASTGVISTPPWGDRTTGSFSTTIPSVTGGPHGPMIGAGVDVFAADYHYVTLQPSVENWIVTTTNPGETKYQFLVNKGGDYTIDVKIRQTGFMRTASGDLDHCTTTQNFDNWDGVDRDPGTSGHSPVHQQSGSSTAPTVGSGGQIGTYKRKAACLRSIVVKIESGVIVAQKTTGTTTNSLDMGSLLTSAGLVASLSDGCYAFQFEFFGWAITKKGPGWVNADDMYNIYANFDTSGTYS